MSERKELVENVINFVSEQHGLARSIVPRFVRQYHDTQRQRSLSRTRPTRTARRSEFEKRMTALDRRAAQRDRLAAPAAETGLGGGRKSGGQFHYGSGYRSRNTLAQDKAQIRNMYSGDTTQDRSKRVMASRTAELRRTPGYKGNLPGGRHDYSFIRQTQGRIGKSMAKHGYGGPRAQRNARAAGAPRADAFKGLDRQQSLDKAAEIMKGIEAKYPKGGAAKGTN